MIVEAHSISTKLLYKYSQIVFMSYRLALELNARLPRLIRFQGIAGRWNWLNVEHRIMMSLRSAI